MHTKEYKNKMFKKGLKIGKKRGQNKGLKIEARGYIKGHKIEYQDLNPQIQKDIDIKIEEKG